MPKQFIRGALDAFSLEGETWKPITGYEGFYTVSNIGRVKSVSRKGSPREFLLRQAVRPDGYLTVGLQVARKSKTFNVHRLVNIAFNANPNNLPQTNHINGNKQDNRDVNLEWCTSSQNIQHAFDVGLKFGMQGEAHPRAVLNDESVRLIRQKFKPRIYTRRMLAVEFGVTPRTVKAVLSGQLWGHVA